MMDAVRASETIPVRSVVIGVRFGLGKWLGPRNHLEGLPAYQPAPCYADSAPVEP